MVRCQGQGHTNYRKEVFTVLKAGPDLAPSGPTSCWATEHEVLENDFVTRAAHPEPDITKPPSYRGANATSSHN